MTIAHFRELEVWQVSMALAKSVYELTARFPREERYGLSSQMQRAAVSIPSNIAEGHARATTREYARYVSIALGSAAELETQMLLARALGMGDDAAGAETLKLCDRVGQMLRRRQQSLAVKLFPSPESRAPSPGMAR